MFSCLQEEPSPAPTSVSKTEEDEASEGDSCGGAFSPEAHRAIGKATEQLGLQLLENLPVSPQQPNVILSPLSLAFALGQLTLGQLWVRGSSLYLTNVVKYDLRAPSQDETCEILDHFLKI